MNKITIYLLCGFSVYYVLCVVNYESFKKIDFTTKAGLYGIFKGLVFSVLLWPIAPWLYLYVNRKTNE